MIITVTGATGTIGSELVRLLSASGHHVRAVTRRPERVPALPGVVACRADLTDLSLLDPVMAGASGLFLLTDIQREFVPLQVSLIRAAVACGVDHVVKLSALGASGHSRSVIGRDHWLVEQELKAAPVAWTILRPHVFMQNWLGDLAREIRTEGAIHSPVGEGRVPFIDTRDIAAVAAEALTHPGVHAGRTYVLTGGEAIGFADVARAISDAIGQQVDYRSVSMEEAARRLRARGVGEDAIASVLALAAYQRAGGATARVSPDVEDILGRPPLTVADFAREHAAVFRRDAGS